MARLIPQSSTAPTIRQRTIPAIMALAGWHWRRQWLLFLLMKLGMICLVFLICLVPALEEVAPTAELHIRLHMAHLPLMSIDFQGMALLLFFLHLMAKILVERQADTLAVLRNQGASGRQILGSLLLQSVGTGLIACIVGPPLAYLTAASLFPERYGLRTFWHNLVPIFAHIWLYAGSAVLLALSLIIATVYYTMHRTMPARQNATANASEPPHWEHLKIEALLALIALATYALSLALFRPPDNTTSPQFPLLAPLAPTLLLVGILPLCLRGTALLSKLGLLMMQPGYPTTPMLATMHTIRPARSLARMTMLLTLAIAFTLFTLIFTASQEQRINDIAASSVGTDFSGTLTNTAPLLTSQPLLHPIAVYVARPPLPLEPSPLPRVMIQR